MDPANATERSQPEPQTVKNGTEKKIWIRVGPHCWIRIKTNANSIHGHDLSNIYKYLKELPSQLQNRRVNLPATATGVPINAVLWVQTVGSETVRLIRLKSRLILRKDPNHYGSTTGTI